MWGELFTALGLLLVLEGIMPFLSPDRVRRTLQQMSQMNDKMLRSIGLGSMILGLLMLYFLR